MPSRQAARVRTVEVWGGRVVAALSRAPMNASALAYRALGFFSSARITIASISGMTVAFTVLGGAGCSRT